MTTAVSGLKPRELQRLAKKALTCPPEEALALLERLGFVDPERGLRALDRLAGAPPVVTPLPAEVLVEIAHTGRPDRSLHHLERYVDVTGGRTALYARFKEDPVLAQRLIGVLAHSGFLADILVRNPEYLFWLFEETDFLEKPLNKRTLRKLLRDDLHPCTGSRECLDALRRVQRRELLRIGATEILGTKDVAQSGRELADLADVVLEIALELVTADLVARYGRPRNERGQPAHFCVICLGKHGGQELNYSSDIDLMFVYDEDGETRPGRGAERIENGDFFRRLGEELIKALTAATHEGFLYRVDMRLRPEGSAGPLVHSLRSCWNYYEARGEIWERQMLIKGRCAAGSTRVWKRFAQMLTPFIYPAHFFDRPQDEIRRVKERIEAHIQERPAGDNNIKLQAGGIRDIEFILQCLQLLNGRVNSRARAHNSLEAIRRLRGARVLSRGEAEVLRQAYLCFRRIENLLQIADGRSAYAVPEDPGERAALGRMLNLEEGEELGTVLSAHRSRVRQIYDELFYGEGEVEEEWEWLLEAEPGGDRPVEVLQTLGFGDGASQPPAAGRNGGDDQYVAGAVRRTAPRAAHLPGCGSRPGCRAGQLYSSGRGIRSPGDVLRIAAHPFRIPATADLDLWIESFPGRADPARPRTVGGAGCSLWRELRYAGRGAQGGPGPAAPLSQPGVAADRHRRFAGVGH